MALNLPQPLPEYFAASNADDADRIAACFAEQATVHDEGHDHAGRDAIRQWALEARQKYSFQSEPLAVDGSPDRPVVLARVTGNFPGGSVDLSHRFVLADGAIVALSIG
jgi:ketosteroid isomerase-like protein